MFPWLLGWWCDCPFSKILKKRCFLKVQFILKYKAALGRAPAFSLSNNVVVRVCWELLKKWGDSFPEVILGSRSCSTELPTWCASRQTPTVIAEQRASFHRVCWQADSASSGCFKDPTEPLLPRWHRGKESACSSGDVGETASIPGLGRSPGVGNGSPLQKFHGQTSLLGYCPWGQ